MYKEIDLFKRDAIRYSTEQTDEYGALYLLVRPELLEDFADWAESELRDRDDTIEELEMKIRDMENTIDDLESDIQDLKDN